MRQYDDVDVGRVDLGAGQRSADELLWREPDLEEHRHRLEVLAARCEVRMQARVDQHEIVIVSNQPARNRNGEPFVRAVGLEHVGARGECAAVQRGDRNGHDSVSQTVQSGSTVRAVEIRGDHRTQPPTLLSGGQLHVVR